MVQEDFNLAQDLFLASSKPNTALEVRVMGVDSRNQGFTAILFWMLGYVFYKALGLFVSADTLCDNEIFSLACDG